MEYKHTKRRSTDQPTRKVQGMWSSTYRGDDLECNGLALSADGYDALVSPDSAYSGAAATARGGNDIRSKSTPKGRENNGGDVQYGRLQSPSNNAGGRNSISMRRSRSAGKQRAMAVGKLDRNDTPASTAGTGASGGGFLGGILRRRKKPQDHGSGINNCTSPQKLQDNICDYCQRVVKGKARNQMFRRLDYAYCSTECTKRHHQALNAEGGATTGEVGATAEAHDETLITRSQAPKEYGFGSAPRTPSEAILQHRQQQGTHDQQPNRNGKQFCPSTVASNLMTVNFSDEKNNSNDEDDDSSETDYCTSFSTGTSFGGPAPGGHTAISNIRNDKYRRGMSDESRDYNDELARQLRLAAKEDELISKERAYRRQTNISARYDVTESSPSAFGTPGTNSTLSTNATASGYSDSNVGESSPGRYAKRLTNMGATGTSPIIAIVAANKNDTKRSNSDDRKNRRHYPTLKQNEYSTQTESTHSLSSSSHGGISTNHDIGSLNAGLQQSGTTSPQIFPQPNSAKPFGGENVSPWRHLTCVNDATNFVNETATVDSWEINSKQSNSGLSRAFEELSGWTSSGMIRDDAKTPRVGNRSGNFRSNGDSARDRLESDNDKNADPEYGRYIVDGRYPENEEEKVIISTYNTKYDRHLSSLSDTSLHAICEDRPDSPPFQLAAHRRRLRPVDTIPSSKQKSLSMKDPSRVDHAVEDVVSIVSFYDDPSVDMLSMNDTITTISTSGPIQKKPQHGRASLPFTTKSPGSNYDLMMQRTTKTKVKASKGQHRHKPKSDPPGIFIDEIFKDGIHRHQQVGRGRNYRIDSLRDPSHGVDPEGMQQLMQMQEDVEEERRRAEENVQGNVHSYYRSPQIVQPHDSFFTGMDPSVHGKDPDDDQQLMHVQNEDERILRGEYGQGNNQVSQRHIQQRQRLPDSEYTHSRSRSTQSEQPQEQRSNSQYDSQQRQEQSHFTKSPENRTPQQLPPSRHEWQLPENDPTSMIVAQRQNHIGNNEDDHVEREESGRFDVADIEFLTLGKDDNDSKLTGEVGDEPSLSYRGDDDTAANTLDTVDLVAEVKRVWRHVQRYEKKKHIKKQMKRQYFSNTHDDGTDGDNVLCSVFQDAEMEEIDRNNPTAINSLLLQPKYNDDGGLKLPREMATNHIRGRASERPPMIPTDGRLGTHIRSTSSHSRSHTPARDSPEMDSTHAMASQASTRASTEKDAVFLNEGVDAFYEGRVKQAMKLYQDRIAATTTAQHSHHGTQSRQPQQHARSAQARTQIVNRLHHTTPQMLSEHSNEVGQGLIQEEHNRPLSQPYDMTKVKSTGTSFTHTTQRVSNMSTAPDTLRSEMARKYMKQRHGLTSTAVPQNVYQPQNPHSFSGIHQP
jgi:hypothetical protein